MLTHAQTNASIVRDLAAAVARVAPTAHLLIISNPVNSTVPIVAEVFKQHNVYDPKRYVSSKHTVGYELEINGNVCLGYLL